MSKEQPRPMTVKVRPEGTPDELKAIPRWVCWRWQHDGQKWRKPPVSCRTGRKADINDPSNWAAFEDALSYHLEHELAGVGLVLAGDGYCGVDIDNCHDPKVGRLYPWAADVIDGLGSYSELSPSATGVKVFVRSLLPTDGRRKDNIEVYGKKHYFTVTGRRLGNVPATVESRQPELLGLYHERVGDEVLLTDDEVISLARQAANGDKFVALFDEGKRLPGHESDSEADLALAAILAFWARGNPARVETLFGRSALANRKKWRRADYRERTIRRALAGLMEFFQPARMLRCKDLRSHGVPWWSAGVCPLPYP